MHNIFSIFTNIHREYEGENHRLQPAQYLAGYRQNVQWSSKKKWTPRWPRVLLYWVLTPKPEPRLRHLDQKWDWNQPVSLEYSTPWKKKALIERKAHPQDGRSVLIHLTPEGIKMRDLSKSFVLDFHDKVMEKTTKIQLKHFFEVMDIINQITTERS